MYIYIYIVHPNHRLPFVHGRTPAHTRHTNDTLPGYNNWICGSREISTKASPRDYAAYFQVMFRQASCVPSSVPGLPNLESTYSCHLATLRHFFVAAASCSVFQHKHHQQTTAPRWKCLFACVVVDVAIFMHIYITFSIQNTSFT